MVYYDIHTHHPAIHPEDIAIVNTIVGMPAGAGFAYPSASSCQEGKQEGGQTPPLRSIGIHPWYISDHPEEQITELRSLLSAPGVVAIGEAGLDKRAGTPLKQQQEIFKTLAALANDAGKPLIIHCVKAWGEVIAIRKEINPHLPWIIHGFRGNGHLAKQLLRQGFSLSFGQYFNPEALREAWPYYAFAETDDNETDIRFIYNTLSTSLQLPLEQLVAQIAQNVHRAFSLP